MDEFARPRRTVSFLAEIRANDVTDDGLVEAEGGGGVCPGCLFLWKRLPQFARTAVRQLVGLPQKAMQRAVQALRRCFGRRSLGHGAQTDHCDDTSVSAVHAAVHN